MEGLRLVYDIFIKINKVLVKIIIFLCYPKEVISIVFVIMRRIKKTIRDFLNVLKNKNPKKE